MLDREPFLQAIFAAPDDDLPRLVFADYLDEQGDSDWAELIRVQCERAKFETSALWERDKALTEALSARFPGIETFRHGFRDVPLIGLPADEFADPDNFRRQAITTFPHWYGATQLEVTAGTILTPEPLDTILTSPVTANVTSLSLAGREFPGEPEPLPDPDDDFDAPYRFVDFYYRPVISIKMVRRLSQTRESRRLIELDLRNNKLDNDALRALATSPHLIRLERLRLTSPDSGFRGRVWQQVHDRFGPEVLE